MIHSGCCFLFHQTFNHATLMFLRRPLDFYCPRREVPGLHIKGLHNLTQACFSASLLCCPEVPDYLLAAKYRLCVLCAEHWSNLSTAPSPQSFPMAGGITFSCFWNPLRIFSYLLKFSALNPLVTRIFGSQNPRLLASSVIRIFCSQHPPLLMLAYHGPHHPLRAVYMALVV